VGRRAQPRSPARLCSSPRPRPRGPGRVSFSPAGSSGRHEGAAAVGYRGSFRLAGGLERVSERRRGKGRVNPAGLSLPVREPVPRWEASSGVSEQKAVEINRFSKGISLFLLVRVSNFG